MKTVANREVRDAIKHSGAYQYETATLPHIAYCSVGNADGTLPLLRCEAITVDEIKLGPRAVALAEHPLGDGGAYAGLWCEGCEKGEKHGELAQNAVA